MAVAHGMVASSRRHWSSAAGCERTTLIRSSGTRSTPSSRWRTRRTISPPIASGDVWRRSWVSAIGPARVLSIGSTPNWTSPATVASATAVKLGSASTCEGGANSRSHAVAAWAPSRPG